jgi:D-aminopeptidase
VERSRIRELGIVIGHLTPGANNAITDVGGVRVGHVTLISGEGALQPGAGPVRTGVTVVLPHAGNLFAEKVPAAVHSINGFGKVAGFEQVRELGQVESPIALTNTLNVGLVMDALVAHAIRQNPGIGVHTGSVNVLVGETNDGYLNDIQGRHVKAEHVWRAIEAASGGTVAEGAVGAGTGTRCMGWKGGIGTASRTLPETLGGFTLGALVQSNFGDPADLIVAGIPVGRVLRPPALVGLDRSAGGSVMVVLATDAPLDARQLGRLCARAAVGLARVGSYLSHGSGDFVVAFSTASRIPHRPRNPQSTRPVMVNDAPVMDALFRAVVESVEEALLNSLCRAETMTGRDGHIAQALPLDRVVEIVRRSAALFKE